MGLPRTGAELLQGREYFPNMRKMKRIVPIAGFMAALAVTPTRAEDACAEKLKAFDYMLTVSKFTAEAATKMYAAREAARAHQKAGRVRECVRVLTQAMGE
jgi:hypothetical protein